MVTNFDYLKNESKFAAFADVAISAEKIILMYPVDRAGINEFEEIREKLRDLMKYIPKNTIKYVTNFTDEILSTEWKESELDNDELKNYKAKAEYYIR